MAGKIGPPIAPAADYINFAFSPDNRQLAYSAADPQTQTGEIWVLDLGRLTTSRVTADPLNDAGPMWSPDGSQLIFRSNRRGPGSLYIKAINTNHPEEVFFEQTEYLSVNSADYSRDGKYLLFSSSGNLTSFDLSVLRVSDGQAKPILETWFNEYHGVISPDSQWVAYVSDETGAPQVYVQSFPGGGQRWQVSSGGGLEPQWRPGGGELFFLAPDRTLMAASVSFAGGFRSDPPTPLFRTRVPVMGSPYRQHYRPTPDGKQFLINTAASEPTPPAVNVVLNWRALVDDAPDEPPERDR